MTTPIEVRAPPWLKIQALIGVGGMGKVYSAVDQRSGETLAVKTLINFGGKQLLFLKNEFRSFAGVVHPNLISQYELVEHGGQWFLLMELLEGAELLYALRGQEAPKRMQTPLSGSLVSSSSSSESVKPGMRSSAATSSASPATASPGPGLTAATSSASGLIQPQGPEERTRTVSTIKKDLLAQAKDDEKPAVPTVANIRRVLAPEELMRALPVLRQVALGIEAIHRSGFLHRDIKPSNVFVSPEGRAVLLDFGIAVAKHTAQTEADGSDVVVGTPAYLAPELLLGSAASTSSDWYAFGITLFLALTGDRPWPGRAGYHAKVETPPPKVKEFAPHVPAELSDLVARLLLPDAEQRPKFAEIFSVLGGREAELDLGGSSGGELNAVVGRHEERKQLRAIAAKARQKPTSIFIRGRSGVGKTVLLAEFLRELESSGCLVLHGRCYEQELVPYKTVDKVVDALTSVLERKREWVESLTPPDVEALTRAFPVLSAVFMPNGSAAAPLSQNTADLQGRAIRALTDVLRLLAHKVPLVVCVDDLQWGDTVSARVLALLSAPGGPPLLVVGGFRAEDSNSPAIMALAELFRREVGQAADVMTIEPLSAHESAELARSIAIEAKISDPALVTWALNESEGQPFFLQQLLYAAAQSPEIAASGSGRGLQDVVAARVAHLPDEARSVLEAVSLAGAMVPLDVVSRASSASHGQRAYQQLRAGHFIRTAKRDGRDFIDTYHDKFREVVSARLPTQRSQDVHAQLMSAWQQEPAGGGNRLFAAAHHAQRAGDKVPGDTAHALLRDAAEHAVASFDSIRAREFLLGAQAAAARMGERLTPRLERLLGDTSVLSDDLDGAKAAYERVLTHTADPMERAAAHAGLARLFMASLNTRQAFAEVNRALEAIRLPVVSPSIFAFVKAIAGFVFAWVRTRVRPPRSRPTDLFEATTYAMAGWSSYFLFDLRLFLGAGLRGYRTMSRLGSHPQAVEWYVWISVIFAVAGLDGMVRRLHAHARALAKSLNDPGTNAQLAAYEALAVDMGGRPVEGEKMAMLAVENGSRMEISNYLSLIGGATWNVLMRGQARNAQRIVDYGWSRMESTGTSLMARGHTFRSYYGTVFALLGKPEEGQKHLDSYAEFLNLHAPGDVFRETLLLGHQAFLLHLQGAPDSELEACFKKHEAYGKRPKNHVMSLRHIYLAKAMRRGDQIVAKPNDIALRKDAKALVATLASFGTYPTTVLHRQLLEAKLAWAAGKNPVALLDALVNGAQAIEAPWLVIEAMLAKAQYAEATGNAAEARTLQMNLESLAIENGLLGLVNRARRLLGEQSKRS